MSDWNGKPSDWGKGHYRDVPICQLAQHARDRQVRDLERSLNDPDFPYYYDDEAADHAVWFINQLRHVEGEWYGQPFELADWQEWDIVRPLLGWKRRADDSRRFRIGYVCVPRKQGKSSLAAAIADYLYIADKEYGAQVYCAATKEDQAKIVWNLGKRMLQASPELEGKFKAYKTSLWCERLGSVFRPLGRDSKSTDGLNSHGIIVDEYHAHQTSELFDVLWSSRGARKQPLVLVITTAGYGFEGPCRKEDTFARQLLEGIQENETYFAYITTVDNEDNWEDPEEWQKANPNLGISVYEQGFVEDYEIAASAPTHQNEFKCKRLNIWTEQHTRWFDMKRWAECDGEIDWSQFAGKRCFAGLDLGLTRDISALCLAFQADKDPVENDEGELIQPPIYLLMRYWMPDVGLQKRYREDKVNYPQWRDQGWISCTPGETTRVDFIRRDINNLAEQFEIAEIAVDPYNTAELMQQLADDGLTVVKHTQGMRAMNFPCRSLEELLLDRRLRHGNDPVLRWMASNVAVQMDASENIRVVKDKSGDRVDGIVAAAMAVGRLLIAPEPVKFIYNAQGMYVA